MLIQSEGKVDILRMDSLHEQHEDVNKIKEKLMGLSMSHASVNNPIYESDFIGRKFHTIEEYLTAANTLSEEDMMVFDMMLAQLRKAEIPPPQDVRRHRVWSEDDGDELDIDRLRVGKPYWESSRRSKRPGPATVTVVADVGALARIPSHKIGWRGATALCITELLEQAGYRVELWAITRTNEYTTNNRDLVHGVMLKGASDPLDLVPLVNAVTGWYKRTTAFAARHLVGPTVDVSYGSTARLTEKELKWFSDDEDLLLCEEVWSDTEAIRLAKELLKKIEERFTSN